MSASVSHTADIANEAQAVVDRVMSRLLAGVDELPVAEDSIDAGQIRIQPRYRWNPCSETQEFEGYEATRVLGFKLTSLESLGDALQMLSEKGATAVDAPQYGSSQTSAARVERSPWPSPMPKPTPKLWPKQLDSHWGHPTTSAPAPNGPLFSGP